MDDCKTLLFDNPQELIKRPDCFLSEDHYYRAKSFLTQNHTIVMDYVLVQPSKGMVYIFGIDDTSGKIFSRRAEFDISVIFALNEKLWLEVLKKAMGFTHHRWEVRELSEDQVIRLQGDLVMKVEKVYDSLEDLTNSIISEYLSGTEYRSRFRTFADPEIEEMLVEEFIREYISQDEELKKVIRLINVYEELQEYRNNEILSEIRDKIREILGLATNRVPNVDTIYRQKVREKKDKFLDFLAKKEEKLKLKYGHATSPHLVELLGILLDRYVVILREQDIIISHEEHGLTSFHVNKPAIVRFGTLDDRFARREIRISDSAYLEF
ncbi:hypothetical protein SJAV_25980 [Sulfurisphaera javensis]|uniref:Uncharacterized protein n=1 Tax=Sulfurisphaera javensis TaxID=2049879 RepID=A0AAT9GUU5_9CREN